MKYTGKYLSMETLTDCCMISYACVLQRNPEILKHFATFLYTCIN